MLHVELGVCLLIVATVVLWEILGKIAPPVVVMWIMSADLLLAIIVPTGVRMSRVLTIVREDSAPIRTNLTIWKFIVAVGGGAAKFQGAFYRGR